jgi:hypothetical protein
MNIRVVGILCVLTTITCAAAGQSGSHGNWVGVWQGELDGQPSVILTLAEDNGTLEGTMVLNIITREGGKPHIAAREPHVLMHPHVDADTLAFQVKRLDSSKADFTVEMNPRTGAKIHCLNCGNDAPVVAMTKQD